MARPKTGQREQVFARLADLEFQRVESIAKAANETASAVVRSAVAIALDLLEERPQLVREIEAGLCKDMLVAVDFNEFEADDLRKLALEARRPVREVIRAAVAKGLQPLRAELQRNPEFADVSFQRRGSSAVTMLALEDIQAPGLVEVRRKLNEHENRIANLERKASQPTRKKQAP